MAARRKTGLDADTLTALRARLADGKRPRIQLTDPQFPAGTNGIVVRIGDPAVDGADFITVRVTVNGQADELPFAPNELDLPGRTRPTSAVRIANPKPAKAATVKAVAAKVAVPETPPTGTAPAGTASTGTAPAGTASTGTAPAGTALAGTTVPDVTDESLAPLKRDRPATVARKPSRKKLPAPPKITITLTSSGATWAVSGTRGAKSVARAAAIAPGVVTAIAGLIDQPAISDAVAEVNDTALAEAQDRARQLRAELAELDAVLAAHQAPRQ